MKNGGYIRGLPLSAKSTTIRPDSGAKIDSDPNSEGESKMVNVRCRFGWFIPAVGLLLAQGGFDLILADYTLPEFDGISALTLARAILPEVPFIFLSGTLDEEVAIDALKNGATDYVFKTRLSRIVPAVQRAFCCGAIHAHPSGDGPTRMEGA